MRFPQHAEKHRRTSGAAFTLIELLVVIAIIAILSAILFPVFAQAREKSRAVACLSNVRQIGIGLSQYVQDFDETFPMGQYYLDRDDPIDQITWAAAIFPYTKQGRKDWRGHATAQGGIFNCPSAPADFQNCHYGYSFDLMPDGSSCPWRPLDANGEPTMDDVATLAEIDIPAEKIGLLEKGMNDGNGSYLTFTASEWDWVDWINYDRTNNTYDASLDGMPIALAKGDCDFIADASTDAKWDNFGQCSMLPRFRHNGNTSVMFLDGHAKAMPRGSIKWYKNIFLPTGAAKQFVREGWYPY
jgi:prepilin-type N-terminal cleavage/methylation domain